MFAHFELQKMVWELPTTVIAKQYGVSDRAVAKWCKSYVIAKLGQGYWTINPRLVK
jgi:hypothetical protein